MTYSEIEAAASPVRSAVVAPFLLFLQITNSDRCSACTAVADVSTGREQLPNHSTTVRLHAMMSISARRNLSFRSALDGRIVTAVLQILQIVHP